MDLHSGVRPRQEKKRSKRGNLWTFDRGHVGHRISLLWLVEFRISLILSAIAYHAAQVFRSMFFCRWRIPSFLSEDILGEHWTLDTDREATNTYDRYLSPPYTSRRRGFFENRRSPKMMSTGGFEHGTVTDGYPHPTPYWLHHPGFREPKPL